MLGSGLVYQQLPYWCGSSFRSLTLSLLRNRAYYDFDPPAKKQPLILFLCGGGWSAVDENVWMPELTWYAKRGFAVASVRYSVSGQRRFPAQIAEIRQAIRFLRAHADELRLDADFIAIMGESGGGHLAAITALAKERMDFDTKEYSDYSNGVNCAVIFYAVVDILDREGRGDITSYKDRPQFIRRGNIPTQELLLWHKDIWEEPHLADEADPRYYIRSDAPPFMLLYGTDDIRVPIHNGDVFYKALSDANVPVEYIRILGGRHGGAQFFQEETKEIILSFLRKNMNLAKGDRDYGADAD
ncbi:MAG: alpha/beta hydrolase [Clostridia bacterium]|nr:alpha/beta hydrolase [Clostridia bacterium]